MRIIPYRLHSFTSGRGIFVVEAHLYREGYDPPQGLYSWSAEGTVWLSIDE